MNPALTSGVSTGTTLALAWKLLQESQPPVPPFTCPAPFAADTAWDLKSALLGLVVGLIIGLVCGPVLEALVSLRLWLFQQALERLLGPARATSRPSFRIC